MHPLLATTLARRGYVNAMPVQAAVSDAAHAGRDLLVSSQTGSGKTLAFGLAMASELLAGASALAERGGVIPRALVVAPTRELAVQVANELGWLFAEAPLRLAAFTGGTPMGGDLRRLRMGVDLVVGTPGRLVDLQRRGALDLSRIATLVLDEADEMLDMGFKEDLEALLSAAPAERRTLLFSATLPRPIQQLASTYQRNAVRIDVRSPGASKAHADIDFRAHLVRGRDRFAAVVNMLLANPDAKSIVFCRTREGVGDLQHKLVEHGFAAVAMAGDRAQGERDRALAALRSGSARILVATNVAARGIDVPDVELVIHGDLPDGAESLTHRSGRTGRAGRKGTSVLLVDPVQRRRAERLLGELGVKVTWAKVTTETEARAAAEKRLGDALLASLRPETEGTEGEPLDESFARTPAFDLTPMLNRLTAEVSAQDLLALLLRRELARLPQALPLEAIEGEAPRGRALRPPMEAGEGRGPRPEAPTRRREPPREPLPRDKRPDPGPSPSVRPSWQEERVPVAPRAAGRAVIFRVNLGADTQAAPRTLLPLICRRGDVDRTLVGSIRVGPQSSTFEIAAEAAVSFARSAMQPDPREPHVRFEAARPPGEAAPVRPRRSQSDEAPRGGPSAAPSPRRPSREQGGQRPLRRAARPYAS